MEARHLCFPHMLTPRVFRPDLTDQPIRRAELRRDKRNQACLSQSQTAEQQNGCAPPDKPEKYP